MAEPSVLFLDQSGDLGGAELCLLEYLRLRTGASKVVVFDDGRFPEALRDAGIPVSVEKFGATIEKSSSGLSQLLAIPQVAAHARQIAVIAKRHDAIYANTQKAAVIGAIASRLSGRPLVWHLHDILDASHFSRLNRWAVVGLTNRASCRVIANSKATAGAYENAGGKQRCDVVYNGIDADRYTGAAKATVIGLTWPSETEGSGIVGIFGRLTPWKGQHILLDALEVDGMQNVAAMVVGGALYTDEDRRYRASLQDRSKKRSLTERVYWLGQRDDVPELMKACDIIVHCSTEPEPFGRVIVEAMLAGKPVIASDAGGAREIVQDGVTGLLTPPGDAQLLAHAIRSLLDDPSRAAQMAHAGREAARRRFALADRAADIDRIISQVVAEWRQGR